MLKIKVSTHTQSNITISKDSVIEFDPYFKTDRVTNGGSFKEVTSIIYKLKTWGKASDYQDGVTPQIDDSFKEYGPNYTVQLTDEQMNELETGTGEFENVFQGVQNIIIKSLESGWKSYPGVGKGNVEYYKAIF